MQATVIVNLRSSRSRRHLDEIPKLLASRGIGIDAFHAVDDNAVLRKRVKRAVKAGAELLIIGGGDGSMTLAANALAHRDTVLGVLPLGTGNSFAQTLGIGEDLAAAVDVIASGHVAHVDLGVVNETYFANFATIGLSAEIAASAPHALKAVIGPAAYALGGIRALFTHRAFRAKIRWDGRNKMLLTTQQMVIANGRYFGKEPVLPDATVTDGKLSFFTTTGTSHLDVVRMYIAFAMGAQTRLRDAHTFSAAAIVIKARPRQPISIDGDALGKTPARFSVARRALRVLVPGSFVDDGN